jgi:dipeptidyl aminopeptidase/acylaminoacyl peptidase
MTTEHPAAGGLVPASILAPFGSWASPIDIDLITGTAVALAEPWLDGDDVYWLESRPGQRGRRTLLRHGLDGVTRELTPDPFKVASRVHEYGGGSYAVDRGRVIASGGDDRLYRIDPDGLRDPEPVTPEGPWRYADLWFDPSAERIYAVRETHDRDRPTDATLVVNEVVAIALDGSDGPGRVLVTGPDFVAGARPSPDGRQLAWLDWDLPDMPWDSVRLRVAPVLGDGGLGEPRTVAGGPGISVVQADWRPDGVLHFVSDETDWWNLYAFDGPDRLAGPARNLAPMDAELGDPAWVFGRTSYGFLPDGSVLAVARADGTDRFIRIDPGGGIHEVESAATEVEGLRVSAGAAVAIVAGPLEGAALERLDVTTGEASGVLARSLGTRPDPAFLPEPEPITFATTDDGIARALYFAPSNPRFRGPDGERPPLVVLSHGGPTGSASSALSLERAFFTSRGIAVVDVDYRGSSGYGRPYRDALDGKWGVYDVDDCIAAARFLVDRGDVDPARLAIRGGSAGGYTTLAALAFRPEVFAAGISHYGIADLELIHVDGHKFELRYDEGLVAPWTDEGRKVFRERSPIHAMHRVRAPVLIFQGLDDRVVPPSQLDAMVAVFTERGIPHVAMTFEGEGHGFRRAETRRAVYEAELAFLGRVFGFTPADDLPPLEVPGLD